VSLKAQLRHQEEQSKLLQAEQTQKIEDVLDDKRGI